MKKPFAILKTGSTDKPLSREFGDFEHWIMRKSGLLPEAFSVFDVADIREWLKPKHFKALIITGSHTNVTENPHWLKRLTHFLQDARESGVPMLGICFGHQLLAYAFGGKVAENPNGAEFGMVPLQLTLNAKNDLLFAGIQNPFNAYMSHRQTVVLLPDKAQLLAQSPQDRHAAFYLPPYIWGVQFHPEFDNTIMRWYLNHHFGIPESDFSRYLKNSDQSPNIIRKFLDLTVQLN